MTPDRTHITIRPRSYANLLDLSLHIFVRHAAALSVLAAVFLTPWLLLDVLLVSTPYFQSSFAGEWDIGRTLLVVPQLVFLQAPLATSPITIYLGRIMFLRPADLKSIWGELRTVLGSLVFAQGLVRVGLTGTVCGVASFLARDTDSESFWLSLLAISCLIAVTVRSVRPFLNEILLLERLPWRPAAGSAVTLVRRNRAMHAANGAMIVGRAVGSVPVALGLLHAVGTTGWFLLTLFLGSGWIVDTLVTIWIGMACWIVAVYFTIVRFVNYLDVRIRSEGWDVQLLMLSAAEMKGSVVHS